MSDPAPRQKTNERIVAGTATVTVLGLALVGTGSEDLGAFLALVGLTGLLFSVHRYGRLGAET